MIRRIPGAGHTRSHAVVQGGFVFAIATAPVKTDSVYDQTKQALVRLDETLKQAGCTKQNILQITVHIVDATRHADMNRAWEEWVDRANPPVRVFVVSALEGRELVALSAIATTS